MSANRSDFLKEIKEGHLRNVYLFTGEEVFLMQDALERLRQAILPVGLEALNETVLDQPSAQTVIEACETLPFMADRRLVLVRDFLPLLQKKKNQEAAGENTQTGEDDSDADAETARMVGWLEHVPETCCAVFYVKSGFLASRKLSKKLIAMDAQVIFTALDDSETEKWLVRRAQKDGCDMDRAAAERMVALAGNDLTRLSMEMDKLAAYAGKNGRIDVGMVDRMVIPSLEVRVFQMIDTLISGNTGKALQQMDSMLQSGESRYGILYMLIRQMRLMTHVRALMDKKISQSEIQKRLDVKKFAADRLQTQVSGLSFQKLANRYRACVQADYSVKSGKVRIEEALDRVILMLQE